MVVSVLYLTKSCILTSACGKPFAMLLFLTICSKYLCMLSGNMCFLRDSITAPDAFHLFTVLF